MAGQNLARDEAGNVWELDAAGNAVRLHTPASSPQVVVPSAPDPDKALRHQMLVLDLQKKAKDATKEQVGDAQVHALAQLYAANKLVPPTRPNEVAQKAIAEAMTLDPNYDPELAANRAKAIKDFSGNGHAAQTVASVNRLAANIEELKSISDKLGGPNTGLAPINKLIAGVEQQGMPKLKARYDALVPEIANQLDKIMKGGGQPTVSGIGEITATLGRVRSQDERNGAFQEIGKMIHGAIAPIKEQWNSAYGGTKAPPMWVSKKAGDFFSSIDPDHADTYGGDDWRGLPGLKGDGTPGQGTPPDNGGGMPSGPGLTPATGATKTEITRGPLDKKIAAMLSGGASSGDIRSFAKANGYTKNLDGVLAFRAMNPTYKGGYDVHEETVVPTTRYNRMAASPLAAGVLSAADAGTAGLTDEATGAVNALRSGQPVGEAIQSADYSKQMLMGANPEASLAGNILGGAGAMIGGGMGVRALLSGGAKSSAGRNLMAWALKNPIKSAAAGDMVYGGAYGAGENNDNRLLGAGVGAPVGALGSFAGSGLSKAAGSVVSGAVNPAVQRLKAAGIPLTVGEALGGGFKKAQDAMTSVFGPGNMVARRYADGRRALNEVGYNTAGQVIDTPINSVGQDAINTLDAAKSGAYSQALDPVSLDLNTPQFVGDVKSALGSARAIPNVKEAQDLAVGGLKSYIGDAAPNGVMNGRSFQEGYRGLSRLANQPDTQPFGYEIGKSLGQGKDALVSALQEQNPGAYEGFLKANSAHRMLSILAKAHNAAKSQITDGGEVLWTPAQLGTASTNNARKYGSEIAAAGGNRPFNQLINDSQQVMSSKLPDSGTPMRLLAMTAATGGLGGLGGGVGYGVNGESGAAEGGIGTLGLLTALGTKKGQQLLTAALLKRTIADQVAGRTLRRSPTVGGDLLASLGIPLLDSPSR